jgi:hypothetical protein
LTERRQTAIQVYLTVNTAIFAVFGLFAKDNATNEWSLLFINLPLVIVGMAACWAWSRAILHYKSLIGWRYQQLIEMEQGASFANSYRLFTKERDAFYEPRRGQRILGFSDLEMWLPRLFIGLYIIYCASLVALAITHLP